MIACGEEPQRKGFSVNRSSPEESEDSKTGLNTDSALFDIRPSGILLTTDKNNRLIPIYKLNRREVGRNETLYYTGTNTFHSAYSYHNSKGNNWNNNYMPGFEALYGFNLVNVHLHNVSTGRTTPFFDQPVLIKTLYYPTFSSDTLNGEPVKRDYYMVSAYNSDSNGDGYINDDDLRK